MTIAVPQNHRLDTVSQGKDELLNILSAQVTDAHIHTETKAFLSCLPVKLIHPAGSFLGIGADSTSQMTVDIPTLVF